MKQELFATPIWNFQLNDHEKMNPELLLAGYNFKFGENFFDLPDPAVAKLREFVVECITPIAEEYQWNNIPPTTIHGRQHPIKPNESDTIHFHPYARLIAVYYLQVTENSGDILLIDPRGGTFWPDLKTETGEYRLARTYHRVKPKPGMLLIFPNYLNHMVETNLSDDTRLSIAMEIYDFPDVWLNFRKNNV